VLDVTTIFEHVEAMAGRCLKQHRGAALDFYEIIVARRRLRAPPACRHDHLHDVEELPQKQQNCQPTGAGHACREDPLHDVAEHAGHVLLQPDAGVRSQSPAWDDERLAHGYAMPAVACCGTSQVEGNER